MRQIYIFSFRKLLLKFSISFDEEWNQGTTMVFTVAFDLELQLRCSRTCKRFPTMQCHHAGLWGEGGG